MKRKLLLLNPATPKSSKSGFIPLPLLILGTYLARRFPNIEVEIIDLTLEGDSFFMKCGGFSEKVLAADAIGITCGFSLNYQLTINLAKKCRNISPRTPILVGGHHANAIPNDFICLPDLFDFVVSGWGETAFEAIWNHLSHSNFARSRAQQHIIGSPLPKDQVDATYDWSLLRKYFQRRDTSPIVLLKFIRGCPARCNFCGTSGPFKYAYSGISPQEALSQLHTTVDFVATEGVHDPSTYLANNSAIDIVDETFGPTAEWRQKFLEGVVQDRFLEMISK